MRGCFANTISDKNGEDSTLNTCQIQTNCFFELSMTTAVQDLATDTSPSFKQSFLGVSRTGITFQVVQITSNLLWWEKVVALWAQGMFPFQACCLGCVRKSSCSLSSLETYICYSCRKTLWVCSNCDGPWLLLSGFVKMMLCYEYPLMTYLNLTWNLRHRDSRKTVSEPFLLVRLLDLSYVKCNSYFNALAGALC